MSALAGSSSRRDRSGSVSPPRVAGAGTVGEPPGEGFLQGVPDREVGPETSGEVVDDCYDVEEAGAAEFKTFGILGVRPVLVDVLVPTAGQFCWPRLGTSAGRHRAEPTGH
jgi:hypothetical protein